MRRSLFPLVVLVALAAPAALQAQSRLLVNTGVGAASTGGWAIDGTVAVLGSESMFGAPSVLVGVRALHTRAIQPVDTLFPVPDDTLSTQALTVVVGRALRTGFRERGALALTPAVGIGVLRHRTTQGAGSDRTVLAGTVLVDVRARVARLSPGLSVDLLATPSLTVGAATAIGTATLGAGLTFSSSR